MKKWCSLFLFFLTLSVKGQIVVDTSYTATELIRDVLVNNNCAETSNYTSFTGTTYGTNGIGYFNAENSDFPFEEGIILSTGQAIDAAGPNVDQRTSGTEQWRGDQELGSITNTQNLFNATYIEFDFIPAIDKISFSFLFASEEYFDQFQCSFSDVFAFILTDPSGVSTNLAIVPETNDPVSVVTIRPGIPNVCEAQNRAFFHGFNGPSSDISFHGRTKSLKAVSDVIPGAVYNIKLVIADNFDPLLDSAVFLEAGSFTADVDLGKDRTIEDGNPLCRGEELELDATAEGAIGYTWYRDSVELTQFDGHPIITASISGNYTVEVQFSALCINTADVKLDFVVPPTIAENPLDLTECELDTDVLPATFDFTENTNRILGIQAPSLYEVTYYTTLEDAIAYENMMIITTAARSASQSDTIYARISSGNSCYEIASFQINVETLDIGSTNTVQESYSICRDSDLNVIDPLPIIATGISEEEYSFSWFFNTANKEDRIIGETGSSLVADQPGVYFVEAQHNLLGCSVVFSTEVIPIDPPTLFEVEFHDDFFSGGNNIEIIVEGNSDYLFSVDGSPFSEQNTYGNLFPGEHIAQVTDINGCTIQTLKFEIIDYPRFFTPNGDGINDEWKIDSASSLDNAQVSIYNRYGQLIKTITADESWDGTLANNALPSSGYWFSISYEKDGEEKVFKSHFALKR